MRQRLHAGDCAQMRHFSTAKRARRISEISRASPCLHQTNWAGRSGAQPDVSAKSRLVAPRSRSNVELNSLQLSSSRVVMPCVSWMG